MARKAANPMADQGALVAEAGDPMAVAAATVAQGEPRTLPRGSAVRVITREEILSRASAEAAEAAGVEGVETHIEPIPAAEAAVAAGRAGVAAVPCSSMPLTGLISQVRSLPKG